MRGLGIASGVLIALIIVAGLIILTVLYFRGQTRGQKLKRMREENKQLRALVSQIYMTADQNSDHEPVLASLIKSSITTNPLYYEGDTK